jgi:hypothetical protein
MEVENHVGKCPPLFHIMKNWKGMGHAAAHFVEAVRYKKKGRKFDSR